MAWFHEMVEHWAVVLAFLGTLGAAGNFVLRWWDAQRQAKLKKVEADVQKQRDERAATVAEAAGAITAYAQLCNDLQASIATLRGQIEANNAEIKRLREEADAWREERERMERRITELEAENRRLQGRIRTLERTPGG
jgi:chromosome segregation ATPase